MELHPSLPDWSFDQRLRNGFSAEELDQLNGVLQLLLICNIPTEHTRQVTYLSLCLFDELQSLHQLEPHARFLLECAALLHDIGWIEGEKNHHKNSLQIILATPLLRFDQKERLVIGSIARYHRKALPSSTHDHYIALGAAEKELVATLASMLRLATALDASHRALISDLACAISKNKITVRCVGSGSLLAEKADATQRSDLMQQVFHRKVILVIKKAKRG